jgi:hypothetical protein
MANPNNNSVDILNELMNADLGNVQTAMPVLDPGTHLVKVAAMDLVDNKDGTGKNLNIKFALVNPGSATINGVAAQVNPGYPVFHIISLNESRDKNTNELKYDPRVKLAQFREAVLGTKAGSFFPLEQYINRDVAIKTSIDTKDEAQFGKRVRIDRMTKVG